MNELRNILAISSLALTFISCKEAGKKNETGNAKLHEVETTACLQKLLVDYKKDTYKISVGDDYTTGEKKVNWGWAALNDPDNKVDSTGKDAFLSLGEPHITYNNAEWLPSLHIETDKNIITSFTCSVLFNLADTTHAETAF
jgi:hypothetical protein